MKILALAFKDLTRKKGKTLYILLALVIPVTILSAIMLTLNTADTSLSKLASKFGFTMTVQPKNIRVDRLDQIGVIIGDYLSEEVTAEISRIISSYTEAKSAEEMPEVVAVPRLYHKLGEEKAGQVIAGVEFETELDARSTWLLEMGTWPAGYNEAVLGGTYAKAKGMGPGSVLKINGTEFTVTGVLLVTNSSDDYMVFIPFRQAQALFEKEGLVSVLNIQSVFLDRDKDLLKAVVDEVNRSVANVRAVSPQQFTTMKFIFLKKTVKFLVSIALATVVVSIFSVFSIVTGALYARVKEIGLLKSVGASRVQLLSLFLSEYFILGLVGGVLGLLLGTGLSYLMNAFFLDIGYSVRGSAVIVAVSLSLGVVCSLVASFWPTYKLSKIKVVETFRTQWEV